MSIGEYEEGLSPTDFPEFGAPKIAGDPSDDDGQVIDSFFVETDQPADRQADTPAVHHDTPPRRSNQLLSGFQVIDTNTASTPFLLMPADPDRKDMIVDVNGTVATDSVRIADHPNKLHYPAVGGTSGQSHRVRTNNTWQSTTYTGALWCIGIDITASVTVSYSAVTD